MNYRHVYHAGNFCDVLKHAVLVRTIIYYQRKAAPFRVIDTHAGCGRYDLSSEEAQRTNEWRAGISKLLDANLPEEAEALLAPYTRSVLAQNATQELRSYPGSPLLAANLLRPQDHLIANELHDVDFQTLKQNLPRAPNVKTLNLDGWTVMKSVLPPKERRAITLVDPPFEQPNEYQRLLQAAKDHQRRFASGTLILWYPIKDKDAVARFQRKLRDLEFASGLVCTLSVDRIQGDGPVSSCGLAVVNPPYVLHEELQVMLPLLCSLLQRSDHASSTIEAL